VFHLRNELRRSLRSYSRTTTCMIVRVQHHKPAAGLSSAARGGCCDGRLHRWFPVDFEWEMVAARGQTVFVPAFTSQSGGVTCSVTFGPLEAVFCALYVCRVQIYLSPCNISAICGPNRRGLRQSCRVGPASRPSGGHNLPGPAPQGFFLVFLLSLGQLRPAPSGRDLRARLAPPKASSETERSALRVSYNPATRILFNFFSRSGERTGAGGGGGAEADNDHVRFRIHYEIPLGPLTPRPPW
jgi:hypothetical protein